MLLRIANKVTKEVHWKRFNDYTEVKHWIINHLDVSLNWSVETVPEYSEIKTA